METGVSWHRRLDWDKRDISDKIMERGTWDKDSHDGQNDGK